MFGRKRSVEPTVIGQGAELQGTLHFKNELHVFGALDGTIEVDGHMIVGADGSLHGDVRADSAVVSGRVSGRFVVEGHLHVRETGRVEGEVSYGTLEVDRGAQIVGQAAHLGEAAVGEVYDGEDDVEDPELVVAQA